MTNRLSFALVIERRHACYLAVAAWLSNFFHGFIAPLDTFSLKWSFNEDGKKF